MQTVSENWKSVHKQTLLNESFVEVSLDVTDPDALADASPSDNGAVYISNSSELTNGVDKTPSPYCTLEQNIWVLDGERRALPESDFGENGYIGDALSDELCTFSNKIPTLTLNFSKVFTNFVPGITITWSKTYDEFADTFDVIVYREGKIVAQKEVLENRSVTSLVVIDIRYYDRIVIQVRKWCLPYHRARVEEILVGINKVYSKSDLFNYSHKQTVDPVSTSLPKNEIRFSINNVDGEYNPYNPQGMAKYLIERQEIKTRYGLKLNDGSVEWIKGGTFYLSEWNGKQNGIVADFTARDLLEFMSDIYYDAVTEIKERSLYDLATSVLEDAKLPLNSNGTVKWSIDESLRSIYTTAPLPNDTHANCLQLIANAAQCVLYQDREGTLHVEPLSYNEPDMYEINSFNSYSKPEFTLSKPIKQVKVKVYSYTIGDDGITSSTTVSGYPSSVDPNVVGETIEVDNPLVTDSMRAESLAKWLYIHLSHRQELDFSWRADVRLDALDIILRPHEFNEDIVRVSEVEFKFNGAFRGTGKGKVI